MPGRRGLSPGATAVLPSDAQSSLRHADNGEDSVKRGDTAKTDKSDTEQSMPVGPTNIHLTVHGGTGGSGGTAMSIWQILMQL
ncbi:hypothetical protein MVEN_02573000 [Mycena venus]|uniref:Uncharacterized protein n=1 Tax=Mycena venus TaxID=2733690 RepID=A0A8H6U251_9AGAR|nr:hypothetical protein MVEN_02573000 [Mycena venus]